MEEDYKKQLCKLDLARNKYINLYKEDIISLNELETYIESIEDEKKSVNGKLCLLSKVENNIKLLSKLQKKYFLTLILSWKSRLLVTFSVES